MASPTACLVYLGIRQWRGAGEPPDFGTLAVSRRNLFVQGLLVTIPNPKSLIFIAARPLGLQFTYIVPTFLAITSTVAATWAMIAGQASGLMQRQHAFQSVLRTGGGLMIIAAAAEASRPCDFSPFPNPTPNGSDCRLRGIPHLIMVVEVSHLFFKMPTYCCLCTAFPWIAQDAGSVLRPARAHVLRF